MRNMVHNHYLARAISDAGWRDLRTMLAYKCDWYGRDLMVVDRWYPSSKTCSGCGQVAASLPLNVRAWVCPNCGARHDRDHNAAINIRAEGLSVLACGDGVRRDRRTPARQSPVKQETHPARAGIPVLSGRAKMSTTRSTRGGGRRSPRR